MANQPTPQAEQPPPDLPSIPGLNDQLAQYLRNFSLWCRGGFRERQDMNVAAPGVLLLSPGGKVFQVTVSDAGAVTATAVPLGGGKP
jgi:hypothetical protein